ncbi:MAG TPA: shikimate dehydrogenase [Chitinivibrionales bacterium]|nr:shikimate dehydrogenase [Chitinivibrionales bacterium]
MKLQRITGATRLVGLLGTPVAHSLSPVIHNHIFAALGLPLAYVPLAVRPHELHAAVLSLRAAGFAGANVTIPHKQAVVPYCDVVSPLSALTCTVNTLYFKDNVLHGTTTDWEGFERALKKAGIDAKKGNIVILGNGGTARTFAFALASQKIPSKLTLVGRDVKKISRLAEEVTVKTNFPVATALFSSGDLKRVMDDCSLCVNCTPVGMFPDSENSPLEGDYLHKGMAVFDVIYNPAKTTLCKRAEKAGCVSQGGLSMLVHQALASCAYWIGRAVDETIVDMAELGALVESPTRPGADA